MVGSTKDIVFTYDRSGVVGVSNIEQDMDQIALYVLCIGVVFLDSTTVFFVVYVTVLQTLLACDVIM